MKYTKKGDKQGCKQVLEIVQTGEDIVFINEQLFQTDGIQSEKSLLPVSKRKMGKN